MDKEPNNKNRLSLQSVRESLRTLSLSTLLLIVTTAVALVAVGSLAWMSENRKLDADGVHANMQGERYSISFLPGATNGLYTDTNSKRYLLSDPDQTPVYDDSALIWKITSDNKIENYYTQTDSGPQTDSGLEPGSYGILSFVVTPNVTSVNLDLTFELISYEDISVYGDSNVKLNEISPTVAQLLNGHIMLFGSRAGEDGEYTYSEPILPDEDGKRLYKLSNISDRENGETVNIYWVWPRTLSTIIDARANNAVTIVPFYAGYDTPTTDDDNTTTLSEVLDNVLSYPQFYLKGKTSSDSISQNDIVTDYAVYGDCYDRADNDIGNLIDYVLVRMTVSESEPAAVSVPEETGGGE